jgi:hypothetical protein
VIVYSEEQAERYARTWAMSSVMPYGRGACLQPPDDDVARQLLARAEDDIALVRVT